MYQETPYGRFLQERLGSRGQVVVRGVSGELTCDMRKRFRRDVLDCAPAYVVVLGGTNDLGWNVEPQVILQNLKDMYERALNAGVQPVGMTVPSIRIETNTSQERTWVQRSIELRHELNRFILDSFSQWKMPCIDLFTATRETESHLLADRFSNDGLHLSTEGYQLIATLLWEQVFTEWVGS